MKLTRSLLGDALLALYCVAFFALIVLGMLDGLGVIDISWIPESEQPSDGVPPGAPNQGPNHVPVRPGPAPAAPRGR